MSAILALSWAIVSVGSTCRNSVVLCLLTRTYMLPYSAPGTLSGLAHCAARRGPRAGPTFRDWATHHLPWLGDQRLPPPSRQSEQRAHQRFRLATAGLSKGPSQGWQERANGNRQSGGSAFKTCGTGTVGEAIKGDGEYASRPGRAIHLAAVQDGLRAALGAQRASRDVEQH
jgi:hypothetical protein